MSDDGFSTFLDANRDISGELNPFLRSLEAAKALTLFEGLPHPVWEKQALGTELGTKSTVEIHRYPFYAKPLHVSGEDAEALRKLLSEPTTYRPFIGEKLCGGFHPDYSFSWRREESEIFYSHICFGCHEFKMFGPHGELRTDMNEDTIEPLPMILRKYRSQRPHWQIPDWVFRTPSAEEMLSRDRSFYDGLGPENRRQVCRAEGCARGTVRFSVFCRKHHFEQVEKRLCPFDH